MRRQLSFWISLASNCEARGWLWSMCSIWGDCPPCWQGSCREWALPLCLGICCARAIDRAYPWECGWVHSVVLHLFRRSCVSSNPFAGSLCHGQWILAQAWFGIEAFGRLHRVCFHPELAERQVLFVRCHIPGWPIRDQLDLGDQKELFPDLHFKLALFRSSIFPIAPLARVSWKVPVKRACVFSLQKCVLQCHRVIPQFQQLVVPVCHAQLYTVTTLWTTVRKRAWPNHWTDRDPVTLCDKSIRDTHKDQKQRLKIAKAATVGWAETKRRKAENRSQELEMKIPPERVLLAACVCAALV